MVDLAQTTHLIGDIYETAASGCEWAEVLWGLAKLTLARHVLLHSRQIRSRQIAMPAAEPFACGAATETGFWSRFLEQYARCPALVAFESVVPAGAPFAASEALPAEIRVVQALMSGCTIGTIARKLGVAEATVKTHLQHVFDKTGTRRQVDLVKRIADHAPAASLVWVQRSRESMGPRAARFLSSGVARFAL